MQQVKTETLTHAVVSPRAKEPSKYSQVDALRGIAFLGVLLVHVAHATPGISNLLSNMTDAGQYGVELFFMMSAFTLFNSVSQRGEYPFWIRDFYVRRFFRIAPLFYVGVLIYTVLRIVQHNPPPAAEVGSSVLFINAFTPAYINSLVPGQWSIGVEMAFYVILPLIALSVRSLRSAAVATVCAFAISATARIVVAKLHIVLPAEFLFFWLPNHLASFGLGIILFFLWKAIPTWIADEGRRERISNLAVWLGSIAIVLASTLGERLPGRMTILLALFLAVALGLCFTTAPFLVNKFTRRMGELSFSAYVTHYLFIILGVLLLRASGVRVPPTVQFVGLLAFSLAGTWLAAIVTHHLFEEPGQKVGRRLLKGLQSRERTA